MAENRQYDHEYKVHYREILGERKLTDETETDMICSAIYHYDDKLVTDSPMDEVLKDADAEKIRETIMTRIARVLRR